MDARCAVWTTWLLLAFSGCSSIKSTLLHRGEFNDGWHREGHLRGVPITLNVPTHLRVDIVEHHFLTYDEVAGDQTATVRWLELDVPVRSVQSTLIKSKQIFTVDPKRPAGGTMAATLGFTGQYFNRVNYRVEDQTIEQITGVLKKLAPKGLIGRPTAAVGPGSVHERLEQVDSIVASGLFEIDGPDLEAQLRAFLDQHLTGCHTCRVVPPATATPLRSEVPEHSPCPEDSPVPCPYPIAR